MDALKSVMGYVLDEGHVELLELLIETNEPNKRWKAVDWYRIEMNVEGW